MGTLGKQKSIQKHSILLSNVSWSCLSQEMESVLVTFQILLIRFPFPTEAVERFFFSNLTENRHAVNLGLTTDQS